MTKKINPAAKISARPWFTLSTPPDKLRTMTREQYYEHKRWLRVTAKILYEEMKHKQADFDAEFMDLMIYGVSRPDIFLPPKTDLTNRTK